MKTSNYWAKLPQEVIIKSIETHQGYDSLNLDVPKPKQRLCPHCGSVHCVIKDSGALQAVRHIPINNRGTELSFHKRRLLCKDCNTTFYETPYWIHPSLHMTWVLYDSILFDLMEPIPQTEIARKTGRLDVRIPDHLSHLTKQYDNYINLIQNLLTDNQILSENDLYRDILKEHNLI